MGVPENIALDACGDEGGVFVLGPSGGELGVRSVVREGNKYLLKEGALGSANACFANLPLGHQSLALCNERV